MKIPTPQITTTKGAVGKDLALAEHICTYVGMLTCTYIWVTQVYTHYRSISLYPILRATQLRVFIISCELPITIMYAYVHMWHKVHALRMSCVQLEHLQASQWKDPLQPCLPFPSAAVGMEEG